MFVHNRYQYRALLGVNGMGMSGAAPHVAAVGQLSGSLPGYRWEAYVARGPVSHGLDPRTLYKGQGRIVRLLLYAPLGPTGPWRKAAAYQRGWLFGRKQHLSAIRDVVKRLDAVP